MLLCRNEWMAKCANLNVMNCNCMWVYEIFMIYIISRWGLQCLITLMSKCTFANFVQKGCGDSK